MGPRAVQGELEPFFFGPSDRKLFGAFHPSRGDTASRCPVVLCPPMGHEHIWCHRAYRLLATRLAHAGFPTLRFDLSGTGDSMGESEDATLEHWVDDVELAVRQVRGRTRMTSVALIGLRLGGALCHLFAERGGAIERMILWDPVIEGAAALQEMQERHAEHVSTSGLEPNGSLATDSERGRRSEILGFFFGDALLNELRKIDLLALRGNTRRVLVLDSTETSDAAPLRDHLERSEILVEYQNIIAPLIWLRQPYQAVVSLQSIDAMVSWMLESEE